MLPTTWSGRGLLESGALTRIPSHGIGRSMKAGKEEIVGLLVALERYLERDEAAEVARWLRLAVELTAALAEVHGLETWTEPVSPPDRPVARTAIRIEPAAYGRSATEIVQAFEARDPMILVADRTSGDRIYPARRREPPGRRGNRRSSTRSRSWRLHPRATVPGTGRPAWMTSLGVRSGKVGDGIPGTATRSATSPSRIAPTVPCSPSAAAASDVIARIACAMGRSRGAARRPGRCRRRCRTTRSACPSPSRR